MPERWPQVERIYSAVVAHPESEWATVLADLCAGDDSLRHEVESLLEHENAASRFLETPACAGADVTGHLASERVLSGRRFGLDPAWTCSRSTRPSMRCRRWTSGSAAS